MGLDSGNGKLRNRRETGAHLAPVRVRCLITLLLLVFGIFGCATPAAHEKWKALDAVESVSFATDPAQKNPAQLHWRVTSKNLPVRSGESSVTIQSPTCRQLEFQIGGRPIEHASNSEWITVPAKIVESDRARSVGAAQLPDCSIEIRQRLWTGEANPIFDLVHRGKSLGELSTPPPRRTPWLFVYPFAAVTDTVLAVPLALVGLAYVIIPGLDDFSWTPGEQPNWDRRGTD